MTTFTTEDRIIAEKDGSFTINVEESPPHIVSGGASVMIKELTNEEIEIIADAFGVDNGNYYEFTKGSFISVVKAIIESAIRYTHPVKELTDEEIYDVFEGCLFKGGFNYYEFARAIEKRIKNGN